MVRALSYLENRSRGRVPIARRNCALRVAGRPYRWLACVAEHLFAKSAQRTFWVDNLQAADFPSYPHV